MILTLLAQQWSLLSVMYNIIITLFIIYILYFKRSLVLCWIKNLVSGFVCFSNLGQELKCYIGYRFYIVDLTVLYSLIIFRLLSIIRGFLQKKIITLQYKLKNIKLKLARSIQNVIQGAAEQTTQFWGAIIT